MAEIAVPIVVTAIANPEVEGFVAGTLFSQGWNVIFRALDISSLIAYIESDAARSKEVVLIFSSDLPGLTDDSLGNFQGKVRQILGFSAHANQDQGILGLHALPKDADELLNLVRGFVRAPLLRESIPRKITPRRSRVIAIASNANAAGCTTLAINLAMELSLLGKETILLDADVQHPSIAPMLSLHKLEIDHLSRKIAPHLSVSEFTHDRAKGFTEYLDMLFVDCDFAVVDLGAIGQLADSLTDRRWTSSLIHWSCEHADELWLLGKCDVLGIHRMESMVRDFQRNTIGAKVAIGLNMKSAGKKISAKESLFLSTVAPLNPHALFSLPRDSRTLSKAEEERAALVEINERSPLRKSIAKIAAELVT